MPSVYTRAQRQQIAQEVVTSLSQPGNSNVHRANAYLRLADFYMAYGQKLGTHAICP